MAYKRARDSIVMLYIQGAAAPAKRKTKLTENGDFRLFAANGKRK
jgi:hypothetical protein